MTVIIPLMYTGHLLCAKCFLYISPFNPHNQLYEYGNIMLAYYNYHIIFQSFPLEIQDLFEEMSHIPTNCCWWKCKMVHLFVKEFGSFLRS